MTLADFNITETLTINKQNELNHQAKLPFDINDYLNFELNEDFISASADFLNDYSNGTKYSDIESDSGDDSDEVEHDFDIMTESIPNKEDDAYFVKLNSDNLMKNEPLDFDDEEDDEIFSFDSTYHYSHDSSFSSSYTPSSCFLNDFTLDSIKIENESNSLFQEKQRKASLGSIIDDNYFPILDIHHEDFQCLVINRNGSQCKDSILCPSHSYQEKYNIQRSEDLYLLIRNFKYLRGLNEKLIDEVSVDKKHTNITYDNVSMERNNSYQDDLTLITHDRSGNLIQQKVSFDSIETIPSNRLSPDVFIEALTLKLNQVNKDPECRLLEFQYRNDLKNFAVSQLYLDNNFDME